MGEAETAGPETAALSARLRLTRFSQHTRARPPPVNYTFSSKFIPDDDTATFWPFFSISTPHIPIPEVRGVTSRFFRHGDALYPSASQKCAAQLPRNRESTPLEVGIKITRHQQVSDIYLQHATQTHFA